MSATRLASSAVGAALLVGAAAAGALDFQFQPAPGTAQEAIDGFEAAGQLWSAIYTDDITVNIDIAFTQLSPGVLGSTGSERVTVDYQDFVNALTADGTSDADDAATAGLQAAPAFDLVINRTSNSPHGGGSATTFLDDDGDANNTTVRLARANAKALGLVPAADPGLDASITFSDEFNWDFDPDDGILPNHFNFIHVAAHEIGHMLGFTSGVDILDGNSPPAGGPFPDHAFTWVTPADLFRFSADSIQNGAGVIDWSADTRLKYFSIDGGTTDEGEFSTGRRFGDGQQASHWRDNLGLGIMDPTVAPGETSEITALDTRLFDVVGWDLEPPAATTDLSISSTASVSLSFTITATNNGPTDVTGATVTDSFPAALTGVSWQCVAGGGASCTPAGTGDIQDTVDLPVGGTVTYTVDAQGITGSAASIAAPSGVQDSDPSNNQSGSPGG